MSRVTRINGLKWICWYSPIPHPKSLHLVGFSCSGTWRGKHQHGSPHRAGEKQCISSIAEEKEKHGRRGELREVLHTRITWPMSKCPAVVSQLSCCPHVWPPPGWSKYLIASLIRSVPAICVHLTTITTGLVHWYTMNQEPFGTPSFIEHLCTLPTPHFNLEFLFLP